MSWACPEVQLEDSLQWPLHRAAGGALRASATISLLALSSLLKLAIHQVMNPPDSVIFAPSVPAPHLLPLSLHRRLGLLPSASVACYVQADQAGFLKLHLAS